MSFKLIIIFIFSKKKQLIYFRIEIGNLSALGIVEHFVTLLSQFFAQANIYFSSGGVKPSGEGQTWLTSTYA